MQRSVRFLWLGVAMVAFLLLQACRWGGVPAGIVDGAPQAEKIRDIAGAVDALEAAGADVVLAGPIEQPFVPSPGRIATVNGHDVQLFEFADAAEAAAMAESVKATGDEIGTSMITWIDAPHFYRVGPVVALYVGSDDATLEVLESVFGPQFAGR